MQVTSVPFEIKSVSEAGRIEGYGAVFNNIDQGMDRIEPGAFSDFVASGKSLPMLLFHDGTEPVGVWKQFAEDKKGLYVAGDLNLSTDSGQADVPGAWKGRALARQGALTGLSIGYLAVDYRFEEEVRVLEKLDLFEISMTPFPMNERARITSVKDLASASQTDTLRMLRERLGISRKAAEMLYHEGWAAYVNSVEFARKAGRAESEQQLGDLAQSLGSIQQWLTKTPTTPPSSKRSTA